MDVFVVERGLEAAPLAARPEPPVPHIATIDAHTLAQGRGAVVIDLARSIDFRDGHLPASLWGIRTRLAQHQERMGKAKMVVLTSPDGIQARRAAAEAQALTRAPVRVLAGGTPAWAAAGYELSKDRRNPQDDACVDFYLRPYDRNSGVEEAMKAYLTWEIELVNDIVRDGTVRFGV
jgi:rhodanese-related sulfurtransferase